KSVHGGVLPWCAQGSNETYTVEPRNSSFPCWIPYVWSTSCTAFTSARGPPYAEVWPSPTILLSTTMTAPTMGLGLTFFCARRARSRHLRIYLSCRFILANLRINLEWLRIIFVSLCGGNICGHTAAISRGLILAIR